METAKNSNSYYLDDDIIAWVAEQASKENRSASYYLNEILRKMKDRKGAKRG